MNPDSFRKNSVGKNVPAMIMGVISDRTDFNGAVSIDDVSRLNTEHASHVPLPLRRSNFPYQNNLANSEFTRVSGSIYDMVKDGRHRIEQVRFKSFKLFNMLFDWQFKGD
ncbi:hypothetical protein D3C75_456370 [compost metagenome]